MQVPSYGPTPNLGVLANVLASVRPIAEAKGKLVCPGNPCWTIWGEKVISVPHIKV
jgi:hypothetical protein